MRLPHVSLIFIKISPKTFGLHCVVSRNLSTVFRNWKPQLSALMMEKVGFSEMVNFSQTPQSPDIFTHVD